MDTRKVRTGENMFEFASMCSCRNVSSGECRHPDKLATHCTEDRRYCPRVAETDRTEQPLWKGDYDRYLQDHETAYTSLVCNPGNIRKLKLKFPRINVERTLDSQRKYWVDEKRGYQVNIKRKVSVLDWLSIYNQAVQRAVNTKTYKN